MSVLCELFLGGNNSLYVYAAQNIIGRAKSCDIRIPGQTVSRKHAMLYERENGWFLCPLDGEVLLNGEKIKKATEIFEGDRFEICGHPIEFRFGAENRSRRRKRAVGSAAAFGADTFSADYVRADLPSFFFRA